MGNTQELIVPDARVDRSANRLPQADAALTPMSIIQLALDKNFDAARVSQLMDIYDRWQKTVAENAFNEAMAAFKENAPVFHKTKHVDYGSGKPKFDYAPLAEVVSKIVPALAPHGLTHKWIPKVNDKGLLTVRCVLSHRLGHSESIESPPVAAGTNGALSQSQNIQAVITFWQRMTLQWITGTAAGDLPDTDEGTIPETIGPGQIADLRALLTETNSAEESFLRVIKADKLENIHVASYAMCVGLLEAKRRK